MSLVSEFVYSIDWTEEGEQHRKEVFASQVQFTNEGEARAAWNNALRLGWVEPHQSDPHVSALYRLNYDLDNGQRSKLRSRHIVADVPMSVRGAA